MITIPTKVKEALRSGSYRKNWRFIVMKADDDQVEDFRIENDNIVKETVSIDERMCTGKQLKFGLCEGSSLQFQYFGKSNIQGRRIKAELDVYYGETNPYTINMGYFDVDACPMQFSTGIMKATAYNKLKSDYLDQKVNEEIIEAVGDGELGSSSVSIQTILDRLLDGFSINVDPNISYGSYFKVVDSSFNANCYTEMSQSGSSGVKTGRYIKEYYITKKLMIDGHAYNPNEYYRYIVDAEKIKSIIDSIKHDFVYNSDGSYINLYALDVSSVSWNKVHNMDYYLEASKSNIIGIKTGSSTVYYDDFTFSEAEKITSPWFTNCQQNEGVYLQIPVMFKFLTSYDKIINTTEQDMMEQAFEQIDEQIAETITIEQRNLSEIEKKKYTSSEVASWADITLRDLQGAVYEMNCEFGKLDRDTDLFSGVTLNNSRLLPAEDLYPSNSLYPRSASERSDPSAYEKLWTDSGQSSRFKDLIITYKAIEDGQETEKKLQRQVNEDGNVNYNMSSNWLFKNLVWTADQVGSYADALAEKLRAVSWIPFEMWCAGMPWLETGDEIEITNKEGTFTSYILTRQLKGIQDLHDTYVNGELDVF